MIVEPSRPVDGGIATQVRDRDDRPFEVTLRAPGPLAGADAMVPATLFPSMHRGRSPRAHTAGNEPRLEFAEPVSPRLLGSLEKIQDILLSWDRALRPVDQAYRRVAVEAPARHEAVGAPGRGTACFFTAGVDSFYTALRHRAEISSLVFVHGFDTSIEPGPTRDRVADGVRAAAALLDLPIVEVTSDARRFADEVGVHWLDYHGSALASVAHLLSPQFERMYFSATSTYAELHALGSHPLLDPLWSSESLQVIHDGAEATRIEKLAFLADHEAPRRLLRVCWENRGGAYNCGHCEKCLRTMVALRMAGVEERFTSLPELRLSAVARVTIPGRGRTWRHYLRLLRATGQDPSLERALSVAVARHRLGSLTRGAR